MHHYLIQKVLIGRYHIFQDHRKIAGVIYVKCIYFLCLLSKVFSCSFNYC